MVYFKKMILAIKEGSEFDDKLFADLDAADKKEAADFVRFFTLFNHLALIDKAAKPLAEKKLFLTHLRILVLVAKAPGIPVGKLRKTLRLTLQGVQRPMHDLIEMGYLDQRHGEKDRRIRNLYLTQAGQNIEEYISSHQLEMLYKVFASLTLEEFRGYIKVASAFFDPIDTEFVEKYFQGP